MGNIQYGRKLIHYAHGRFMGYIPRLLFNLDVPMNIEECLRPLTVSTDDGIVYSLMINISENVHCYKVFIIYTV